MINSIFRFIALVFFVCFSLFANAQMQMTNTEEADRLEVRTQVSSLFSNENWKELDALATHYREGLPTTSAGTHKLILFYFWLDEFFTKKNEEEQEKLIKSWLKAQPQSIPARFAQVASARSKAGKLRGTGYIDTVDPSIIPKYMELLEETKKILMQNKAATQSDPYWYALALLLARLQSDQESAKKWLLEGSERFPYYQNIYFDAVQTQLPKWGGTPEGVEEIARFAVERTKNKLGLAMYAYVWSNAIMEEWSLAELLKEGEIISWTDMRQGFEDRLKSYPSAWVFNHGKRI